MYYLQKICILIENKERRKAFDGLKEGLAEAGILLEDIADKEILGTLFITDTGEIAQGLMEDGKAVLVYLHSGNRNQSFGSVSYAFEEPETLNIEYLERVYRRYAGIPWDILETKRCYLRETIEEDVPVFYEIYKEPSITAYMEDLFEDPQEELAYTRDYREKVYGFYGFGIWTVIKKETGEIIGRAGCTYREGFDDPELGFVIGVPWQRQGYAREVCEAVLEYAKEYLGFERIQAFVKEGNQASIGLCTQLGMKEVGKVGLQSVQHIHFMRDI